MDVEEIKIYQDFSFQIKYDYSASSFLLEFSVNIKSLYIMIKLSCIFMAIKKIIQSKWKVYVDAYNSVIWDYRFELRLSYIVEDE